MSENDFRVLSEDLKKDIGKIKQVFNSLKFTSHKSYGNRLNVNGALSTTRRVIMRVETSFFGGVLKTQEFNREILKNLSDDAKTATGRAVKKLDDREWYVDIPAYSVHQFVYSGAGNNPSLKEGENFSVSLIVLDNGNAKIHFANGNSLENSKPFLLARSGNGVFESAEAPVADVVKSLLRVTSHVKDYSDKVTSQNELRTALFKLLEKEFNPIIIKTSVKQELSKKQLSEIDDLFNIDALKLMLTSWKNKHWKDEKTIQKEIDALPVSQKIKDSQSVVESLIEQKAELEKALAKNIFDINEAKKLVLQNKRESEEIGKSLKNPPFVEKQYAEMEKMLRDAIVARDKYAEEVANQTHLAKHDGSLINLKNPAKLPGFELIETKYESDKLGPPPKVTKRRVKPIK